MEEEEIPGFMIPVHRALTTPLMMAGVPRNIAIINGTITAALGLGLHCLWAIPLGIVIHAVARLAARQDPMYFEVLRSHIKQHTYYYA